MNEQKTKKKPVDKSYLTTVFFILIIVFKSLKENNKTTVLLHHINVYYCLLKLISSDSTLNIFSSLLNLVVVGSITASVPLFFESFCSASRSSFSFCQVLVASLITHNFFSILWSFTPAFFVMTAILKVCRWLNFKFLWSFDFNSIPWKS